MAREGLEVEGLFAGAAGAARARPARGDLGAELGCGGAALARQGFPLPGVEDVRSPPPPQDLNPTFSSKY